MTVREREAVRSPVDGVLRYAELLHEARLHEGAGRMPKAIDCYVAAIAEAGWSGDWAAQAVGLRRLAVLYHQCNEQAAARETCRTSYNVALRASDSALAAEALHALADFELRCGNLATARDTYRQALALCGENDNLRTRIDRSLGLLATVQGNLVGALEHFHQSFESYMSSGPEHACAAIYHKLGMESADRGEWEEADRLFLRSQTISEAQGDVHLQGLCTLDHAGM